MEDKNKNRQFQVAPNGIATEFVRPVPIDELIGLERVKQEVADLRNFAKVQQTRTSQGIPTIQSAYHSVFLGKHGTGKTTVARIVAGIYREYGILTKGHLVKVQCADLVGESEEQTKNKTNAKIDEALDGILYIDEANMLSKWEKNDCGYQAISTLLKRMKDDNNRLVVILAGYDDEMKRFLDSNSVLQSFFNRYFHFEDYSYSELMELFMRYLDDAKLTITDEARRFVRRCLRAKTSQNDPLFRNIHFIRDFFEKVVKSQANRVALLENCSKDDLCQVVEKDVKEHKKMFMNPVTLAVVYNLNKIFSNESKQTSLPFIITDVLIGNVDNDSNITINYGGGILSSKTQYLKPKLFISTGGCIFLTGKYEIFVKLYDSNGKLHTGKTSPAGYSYKDNVSFNVFNYKGSLIVYERTLMGWGGDDLGHYKAGNYRFEFYYNDILLFVKKFTIYSNFNTIYSNIK